MLPLAHSFERLKWRKRDNQSECVREREGGNKGGVIRNDQNFHLLNGLTRLAVECSGDLSSSDTD